MHGWCNDDNICISLLPYDTRKLELAVEQWILTWVYRIKLSPNFPQIVGNKQRNFKYEAENQTINS